MKIGFYAVLMVGALSTTWSSTGTETDPSAAFGARFGESVATSNNWIAITRRGTSPSDNGRTELWQWSTAGWAHKFTWQTPWVKQPVVALSANWLVIGEPCVNFSSGCQGRVVTFIWNGLTWVQLPQSVTTGTASDFGSALAVRDISGSGASSLSRLAVAGGGVVTVFSLQPSFFVNTSTLREPATSYLGTGFGSAVAVTSDGVMVSAPTGIRSLRRGVTGTGFSPGFVYDFNLDTTGVITRLAGVGVEGANAPGFGASLSASVDGKSIAVGAASEVGRSSTAYVFRLGSTGNWGLANTIFAPAGATGSSISVAIDGYLGVLTNAAGSTTQGTLRLIELSPQPFGPTVDATYNFDDAAQAPMDLRGGRVIVGQPGFLGDAGSAATYGASTRTITASP